MSFHFTVSFVSMASVFVPDITQGVPHGKLSVQALILILYKYWSNWATWAIVSEASKKKKVTITNSTTGLPSLF